MTRQTATPRSIFARRGTRSLKATTRPKAGDGVTSTRSCWISVIAPYHRDARMAHQFGRPRKQQIGLHPVRGVPVRAVRALVAELNRLRAGAQAVIAEALRLRRRQELSARQIAVPLIPFDIFPRQHELGPVYRLRPRLRALAEKAIIAGTHRLETSRAS